MSFFCHIDIRQLDTSDRNRSDLPIVPDAFEEIEALSESQLCRIFPEYHIVTTTRRDEYDRRYIVKALYPFSSFVALATDVEHAAKQEKCSMKHLHTARDRDRVARHRPFPFIVV